MPLPSFSAGLIKFYRPALLYWNDIRFAVCRLPDSMLCTQHYPNKWSDVAFAFTPSIFNVFLLFVLSSDRCPPAKALCDSLAVVANQVDGLNMAGVRLPEIFYCLAYFFFFSIKEGVISITFLSKANRKDDWHCQKHFSFVFAVNASTVYRSPWMRKAEKWVVISGILGNFCKTIFRCGLADLITFWS